jgi:plastocyanin
MNKNLTILILVIIVLVIAGLGVFFYYQASQSPKLSPNANALNQQLLNVNPKISANQNTNTDIGLPNVSIPAMQGTPIINSNTNQPDYQPISISIANFTFNPKQPTVKIGTTVTWINDDPAPHQIAGSIFAGQLLNTGDSYSFTFTQAGTYDYYCSIHPSMTGTILVQ